MKLTPRAYQLAIYHSILEKGNTLVVLPTGLGKTLLALMLIRDKVKEGRCLFVTPTKPLAKQHFESVKEILDMNNEGEVALVTGEHPPKKRKEMYESKVVISTPQTVRNDIQNGLIGTDFVLFIVDEAHRSIGDYAYVEVAQSLEKALIVGLTASPGGKRERITEVMKNLKIQNIEIRTQSDDDVKEYVKKSNFTWIPIQLSPTLKLIKKQLDDMITKHAHSLTSMGFPPPIKHKGQFLAMRERILNRPGNIKYAAIVQYTILLNLLHMVELIETQGVFALRSYMEKVDEKTSKSAGMLRHEAGYKEVLELCKTDEEHPKLKALVDLVKKLSGKKMIVFAQYRDQIKLIERELQKNDVRARLFVGKRDKYTRKQQEETIQDFRDEKFDVLVSSSIAEEGLDIPAVDSVIFYEPIPSEIRTIQRRGRAARMKEGELYILMTRGTRDEYFYWSARKKEAKMKTILNSMQDSMEIERKKNEIKKEVKKTEEKKGYEAKIPKTDATGQTKMSEFV
ncbi:MAG: helicase-related protein [Candidatus Micrarchaeota archaeon]